MSKLFKWFKKDKKANESNDTEKNQDLDIENSQDATQTDSQDKQESPSDDTKREALEKRDFDDDTQENSLDKNSDISTSPTSESGPTQASQAVLAVKAKPELTPELVPEPESEAEIAPEPEPEPEPKEGLLARLKASLSRTKENIGSGFGSLLRGKKIDDDLYEELETQLLMADVGMTTTNKIINELISSADRKQLKDGEALSLVLQEQMQNILDNVNQAIDYDIAKDEDGNKQPFVILMVGVNGVGKTTTIGKLAKQFQAQGKSVMLAAGDTFRAAAVEQLQVWGERNNIPVVAQHTGADSASVIFDSIESAKAKNVDILIADTAGRLQNKDNLIEELKKVVRVMKKLDPKAPHEIMLTLDASTGQNAISQTKIFNEAVGITGINLTKLDGTAKGGVIFALADEFSIPVRYIGIGEGIDDLRPFESKPFVEALFEQ